MSNISLNLKKRFFLDKSVAKTLLYLTICTFFVVTVVVIATPIMSNNQTHNAIFGSFDSTGAAIILIGFPYLALQYLKFRYEYM